MILNKSDPNGLKSVVDYNESANANAKSVIASKTSFIRNLLME